MKAATCVEPPPAVSLSFQSTPPVKAATRKLRNTNAGGGISIHAAREGGDLTLLLTLIALRISIHAAREGGDCITTMLLQLTIPFQSTPPVKAAT